MSNQPIHMDRHQQVRPCAYCGRGTKRVVVLDYGVASCCVKCAKPYLERRAQIIAAPTKSTDGGAR